MELLLKLLPSVPSALTVLLVGLWLAIEWRKHKPSGGIDEINKVLATTTELRRHVTDSLNIRLDAIEQGLRELHGYDPAGCARHSSAIDELRKRDSEHARAIIGLRTELMSRLDSIDRRLEHEATNPRLTRRPGIRNS